jgi:hypothetical protein
MGRLPASPTKEEQPMIDDYLPTPEEQARLLAAAIVAGCRDDVFRHRLF